ncbi:hypothetical protein K470DRAFT_295542 [Piedraia hortae CBS 480.64]|uniref:DUF659 domain-containing protein n=1 Tax=Piedraia hortae CBS 480.64 TaxID=1314780 RepID=A0A6A7BWU7_9PEZI|nr:hypothetical protein K470DRAFT_295542 [Piedraia hortae CBS 480.64]
MPVTPNGRSFFYGAIPSGVNKHSGEYLCVEVGPEKTNAISTDTALNILKAIRLVRIQHSLVYLIGCNSHQFDLLIKDILKLPALSHWLTQIAKFFRAHQVHLAELKLQQVATLGKKERKKKKKNLALPVKMGGNQKFVCNLSSGTSWVRCRVQNGGKRSVFLLEPNALDRLADVYITVQSPASECPLLGFTTSSLRRIRFYRWTWCRYLGKNLFTYARRQP